MKNVGRVFDFFGISQWIPKSFSKSLFVWCFKNRGVIHSARIEGQQTTHVSENLPLPLFCKEGNHPPFGKGRTGGIFRQRFFWARL